MFKYKVILVDTQWKIITNLKLKLIPRQNELIYLDKYYRVINVIHHITKKNTLIVVEEITENE